MTLAQYLASFDAIGSRFICIPASSSISGMGYDVGIFPDGLCLKVGKRIVCTTSRTGYGLAETLATVGRLLTGLSPETRAAQLAGMGVPDDAGIYTLAGTRWNAAGDFLGLA